MCITEYGSAQFDHVRGAGIEIINGEEQLKLGFRIATMDAYRQGLRLNLTASADLAERPAEQRAVEASGGLEVGNPKFDVRGLSWHDNHLSDRVHTPRYVQSLMARLSRSGEQGRCWESSGALRLLVGERQIPLGERLTEQPCCLGPDS
jgi:hypothetical protein